MGSNKVKSIFLGPVGVLLLFFIAAACAVIYLFHASSTVATLFDKREAYAHLVHIVNLGPRPSGSKELQQAREYIESTLRKSGLEVDEDSFTPSTPLGDLPMKNICAVKKGGSDNIVIIGSHYETKYIPEFPFVGAEDDASGMAVQLELGRVISRRSYPFTVWLVFFDGEEAFIQWSDTDGTYGSRRFVEQLGKRGLTRKVKALIHLDMVGDRDLLIERESQSTPALRDLMLRSAKDLGFSRFFSGRSMEIADDHVPFLKAGIPALDIIDFDYRYWHTSDDTAANVSEDSLGIVGQVVERLLDQLK